MFVDVIVVLDQLVEQFLLEVRGLHGKPGNALEHVHHEVPAIQVIR